MLRKVAQSLTAALRLSDPCYRWGGDEFVALLPDADLGEATDIAERMRSTVAAACQTPDGPPRADHRRRRRAAGSDETGDDLHPARRRRAARAQGRAARGRAAASLRPLVSRAASAASKPPRVSTADAALAGSSSRATTWSSSFAISSSSWADASSARRSRCVAMPMTSFSRLRRRRSASCPSSSTNVAVLGELLRELLDALALVGLGADDRDAPAVLVAQATARRGSRGPSCPSSGGRPC